MEFAEGRPRLPALTSLRFFAALHVVFFHLLALKIMWNQGWLKRASSVGYVGVSFFFVLSGFILVYTYAGREMTLKGFWRARFARIYPAYVFSLIVTGPFFLFAALMLKIPFYEWFGAHLKLVLILVPLLLQAWIPLAALAWNSVAWSLSDETFFYFCFPFLQRRVLKFGAVSLAALAALCWLASMGMTGFYTWKNPDHLTVIDADVLNAFWLNAVKFHPLARLPEFLLGMACGAMFLKSQKNKNYAAPLILLGLSVCTVVVVFSDRLPYAVLHTSLLALAFAAIIYGFALRPNWGALLEWKPLEFLGDASYSLYLLHSFIMGPFFYTQSGDPRHRSIGWVCVYFVLAISISGLVYRFIEEPARRKLRGKKKTAVLATLGEPPAKGALA